MRPCTLPEPWYGLQRAAGGVEQLAEELLVTPRTIRRWASGTAPQRAALVRILAAFFRYGITPPRELAGRRTS